MGLRSDVRVRQPAKDDLVGRRFVVTGIGSGFEGTIGIRVRRGDRVVGRGFAQSAGGGFALGEFSTTVELDRAPRPGTRLVVEVFGDTGDDGPGSDLRRVEVICFPDLAGWLLHRVERGDTLTGIVRQARDFGRTTLAQVVAANPAVTDPDVIRVGQLLRVPLS
ncbi:Gmad2 immunoglobulin-like domain-containing protein [Nocardioides aequoreus]|uniref:Gmad2 immunoglobulin-like domain-containing protein n=1 Tax=Nocardioides aequoreus TaxID=397278 RepID=UPI0004C36617|nr:Gmad2 immunoglobulin-like domain-containing protein [Nocardioides aequoreus]